MTWTAVPVSERIIAAFPAVVDLIYNPKDTELLKRHAAMVPGP
jgi:shikimate dehydrogenase